MAREARQRISYVLSLPTAAGGHRLGINGLAIDAEHSQLYSGGRDGLICVWRLDSDFERHGADTDHQGLHLCASTHQTKNATIFHKQVQAHTDWVNDILLTQSNSALVSASSDATVKLWRPNSEQDAAPKTVGLHSDYVKCLASPGPYSEWIASGGLDHKIRLWDLNGGGQRLQIDAGETERSAKNSVYALSVKGSILASGGPESIVRLWDPRTGKRITNFVGHTDNIRDILLNQDGDTVMTASSDQSIKVWSITAGRCMYTLTMHNDSVWSLYSDHPKLSLFYSSDRSGLIAKTDVRHCDDMDEGMSVAVGKEHLGVNKIIAAGDHIWTATASSSINRWCDVDTQRDIEFPETAKPQRVSSLASRTKIPSPPSATSGSQAKTDKARIPLASVLRISMNAPIPGQSRDAEASTIYSGMSARKFSEAFVDQDSGICVPFHNMPEETVEGQYGLIKQITLNDRRRALTLDTNGEITLWDLLECAPIKSFGNRHLDDVRAEVDNTESIANWCGVETHMGKLVVTLDKNYCFNAEAYADDMNIPVNQELREDQRINLGKWALKNLFATLIDREAERDLKHRQQLMAKLGEPGSRSRAQTPAHVHLPKPTSRYADGDDQDDAVTAKVVSAAPVTPGSNNVVSSSQINGLGTNNQSLPSNNGSMMVEDGSKLEKQHSSTSRSRPSMEKNTEDSAEDSAARTTADEHGNNLDAQKSHGDTSLDNSTTTSPTESKDEKSTGSLFGKKFRMTFPKKLGRSSIEVKQSVIDEKSEGSDKSVFKEDKSDDHTLLGTLRDIRAEYQAMLQAYPSHEVISAISVNMPNDTPRLQLPPSTSVLIQEEQPHSGAIVDLYWGSVGSLGDEISRIERCAPKWLGDILLRNRIPEKELGKVSFILQPYKDLLPSIVSSDGNTRLTANRMLRAKKVLAYVAERIETLPVLPDPDALKPEEYLELYCQDQLLDHDTTLGTMRAHIWKSSSDIMLYYKSNGRKVEVEAMQVKKAAALTQAEISGKVGPTVQ